MPTNGVAAVKTTGKNDSPIAAHPPESAGPAPAGMLLVSEAALRQIARAIDDALSYLAEGWTRVMGRTERQMVMQILDLLASAPAPYVPRIDYRKLIADCYTRTQRPQGSPGCVHFKMGAEWFREQVLAAPPAASGDSTPPSASQVDAVELEIASRYVVEKRSGGGFWPYCVRAGDGARELFVGHKKACDNVRAALESACLDGAFMARSARGRSHHG